MAAAWIKVVDAGVLTEEARRILNDEDAGVVARLLERLEESAPLVREELKRLATTSSLGWLCRSCRYVNPPGRASCANCSIVGPELEKVAAKLLEQHT